MKHNELGKIVASGRATPEQWDEYWSGYANETERQRLEKEEQEREVAEQRAQQEFDDKHPREIRYREKPVETPRKDHSSAAGTAGVSLGSALAVVLSFQLNHSILWAIVHGILSWFYVLYRAWQGNY